MENATGTRATGVRDDLADLIGVDFAQACVDLAQARLRRRDRDSPENRAAVAECSARVDGVLDLFLEACRGARLPG